jgi:hypothetical protein
MILTNLRKYYLKPKKLVKLILTMNRNWPNDYKVGCISPSSNLIEFIGIDANLKKKVRTI